MYPQTNPKNLFNKRLLALLALVIAFLLAYGIYLTIENSVFHVVSTNPSTNSVATVSPFFNIYFNRDLKPGGIKISSMPNIISSYHVVDKVIYIKLITPLRSANKYTITLNSIRDSEGDQLGQQSLSFTPQYIPSQNLPYDQRQALLKNQVRYNEQHSNPIVKHLPHSTPDFNLTYGYQTINNQQHLVLNAELFIPQAQANNISATAAQDQQEILQYIQSLNLNPSSYTIHYKNIF